LEAADVMSSDRVIAAIALGAMILAVAVKCTGPARAQSGMHGDGHAEMHETYKGWHPPGNPNTSCCSNADCRPTRAYVGDDGLWRAWNGLRWLTVPQSRVLPAGPRS
jgi:hypothetical protein